MINGNTLRKKKALKHLTLHIKELEKEEQTKPKVSRIKEIPKIRAEIINMTYSDYVIHVTYIDIRMIKQRQPMEKINEMKMFFF